MPEAKERPHWKRTLAVLAVMVGGFAFQETGGSAPNFMALVVFRALQGAGGALFSLSFAVMRDEAPDRLSVAIGVLVGAFGLGASAGTGLEMGAPFARMQRCTRRLSRCRAPGRRAGGAGDVSV